MNRSRFFKYLKNFLCLKQINKITMALNPQYEDIGKGFVQQYYAMFDDVNLRPNLISMYNVSLIYQLFKLLIK